MTYEAPRCARCGTGHNLTRVGACAGASGGGSDLHSCPECRISLIDELDNLAWLQATRAERTRS